MRIQLTLIALCLCLFSYAQVDYDARTVNEPWDGVFRPGVNLGYWEGWSQKDLGDLVADAGGRVVRPVLSESVLEIFGYDLLLDEFEYWKAQGMGDFVATLGFPVDWHKDWTEYCPGKPSTMFANMYTPIWDDGENGTPYNDENYFAAYVYKCVTTYTEYVEFWEIWNQPGFDETFNLGWRAPGDPVGNWWDQDPDPCDYILKAPIEHYIRTLRIAYEVIKTVSPEDKVMAGGFGFQSFLDAVLRNTDNPYGGSATDEFPLGGGAYFEIFVIHNYPHFDGSTRDPDGSWHRHSDRAAQGLVYRKEFFQEIYDNYGYDGVTYPAKQHLATEMNVPRAFDEPDTYFASEEGQRNYIMKCFPTAILNDIIQFHVYSLVDKPGRPFGFDKMGLWEDIIDVAPGNQVINVEGIAMRTTSDILWGTEYDAEHTAALNMPNGAKGYAFKQADGRYLYMLWAETTIDLSEEASATYSFPADLGIQELEMRQWDYFQTQASSTISSENIELDATPVFFISDVVGDFLAMDCGPAVSVELEIGQASTTVSWTEPNVISNCDQGVNTPVQVSGPANGSLQAAGTYTIEYEVTNDCGQDKTCSFTVEVLEANTDCFSEGIAPWNEWIAGVSFSTINKESGKCDPSCGYADYTGLVAEALYGETYPIVLTPGISFPTYETDIYWSIWIDFNNDGHYHNSTEKVFEQFGSNQPVLADLLIDPLWPSGIKTMRISASKGGFADPCQDIAEGEVEDYSINITDTPFSCVFESEVNVQACSDNGTEYDPNDDYYLISINVNGVGLSSNWTANTPNGVIEHPYGESIAIGPFAYEDGPFDMVISDSENSTCSETYEAIGDSDPCSDTAGPDCVDNILVNKGFENGQGWEFWFYAYFTSEEHSGQQGIEIVQQNHRVYQWVDVTPGSTYTLNAFAKMSQEGELGKVGIRFLNSNWMQVGNSFVDVTNEAYEPISTLMVNAPVGATILEVTAINQSPSATMYIDDFCLSELPGESSEAPGFTKGSPLQLDSQASRAMFGQSMQAYPNPAHGNVNLDFGLLYTPGAELKIYDGLGAIVDRKILTDERQISFGTKQWEPGLYFIELRTESGEHFVERLVVQR